jgi:hypothetical protein
MKLFLLCCLVTAVAACGCKKEETLSGPDGKPVAADRQFKIRIGLKGEIYANDRVLSQEEFFRELQRIKQSNGGIVYTRDNPGGESTPAQSAVLQILQDSEIPLQFSR